MTIKQKAETETETTDPPVTGAEEDEPITAGDDDPKGTEAATPKPQGTKGGPEGESPSPPAPSRTEPAAVQVVREAGESVEDAVARVLREDEHRKEHETLGELAKIATAPVEPRKRSGLARLFWGDPE